MIRRTEAIVLKTKSFAEADLIVTYLTEKHGLINTFAKSPKKIKSRFGSSLEPLTYSNISFFGKEDATLPRLIQSDIINPFESLKEDFLSFQKIFGMLNLCIAFLPEHEPNEEIFLLLLNTLRKIQANNNKSSILILYYKLKFLKIAGLLPCLETCGRCGRSTDNNEKHYIFFISDGSILCNNCFEKEKNPFVLSGSALNFFRSILKWDNNTIDRIKAPDKLIEELLKLINTHINYIIGSKTIL